MNDGADALESFVSDGRRGYNLDDGMISVQGVTGQQQRDQQRPGFELVSESEAAGCQELANVVGLAGSGSVSTMPGKTDLTRYRARALIGSPAIPPLSVEDLILSETAAAC